MNNREARQPETEHDIQAGPSRALCRQAAAAPTVPVPPFADRPSRSPTPRPLPSPVVSRWWYVFGGLVIGIAVLLAIDLARPAAGDADDDDLLVHPEWLDEPVSAPPPRSLTQLGRSLLFGEIGERPTLSEEVQDLRERLRRVEERQRRLSRALETVD